MTRAQNVALLCEPVRDAVVTQHISPVLQETRAKTNCGFFFFTLRTFIGTEMNPVSRVYLCGQLILCTLHLIKICERVTVVRTFHPEILTPACEFNPQCGGKLSVCSAVLFLSMMTRRDRRSAQGRPCWSWRSPYRTGAAPRSTACHICWALDGLTKFTRQRFTLFVFIVVHNSLIKWFIFLLGHAWLYLCFGAGGVKLLL